MNIILTGLRGSGKSSIGKRLAKKINKKFIDMDKEIENNEKMSISKMVEKFGWEYFREKEHQSVKRLSDEENLIISTGGGTITFHRNQKILKKSGKIIYLYCKPEVCTKRIINDPNRPPLTNKESTSEEMKELYKQRNGIYCETADIIFIRSENLDHDVEQIIEKLNLK